MNYANIKYYDIANGLGGANQPIRIRLHPPLQRLLQ